MSLKVIKFFLLMGLVYGLYSYAFAQDCETRADVLSVAPGVYLRAGHPAPVFEAEAVANIGFIVGERCVAVIDSGGSLAEGRALRCAISATTPLPVCYVILTHVHPDHSLGAAALIDPETKVIGHANLARALSLVGQYYLARQAELSGKPTEQSKLVVPDQMLPAGQSLALDIGNRVLTVQSYQTAHSDSDVSVLDQTSGTLWLGDLLFLDHIPVVDGSSQGWLTVLEELRHTSAARVIPGHGPVSGEWPAAIEPTRRYLELLRQELRAWIDKGKDMLSAQNAVGLSARSQWLLFENFHKRNISKVFAELEWE